MSSHQSLRKHLSLVSCRLYECNVCGEGGEYESLVLDCPLFKHARIVLDSWDLILQSADAFAPVGHLHPVAYHLEPNEELNQETKEAIHQGESEDSCQRAHAETLPDSSHKDATSNATLDPTPYAPPAYTPDTPPGIQQPPPSAPQTSKASLQKEVEPSARAVPDFKQAASNTGLAHSRTCHNGAVQCATSTASMQESSNACGHEMPADQHKASVQQASDKLLSRATVIQVPPHVPMSTASDQAEPTDPVDSPCLSTDAWTADVHLHCGSSHARAVCCPQQRHGEELSSGAATADALNCALTAIQQGLVYY